MADTITPDAPAESSTATLEVPSDGQAYAEWRMTGKLPEAPAPAATPKKEAPAASQEHSAAGEKPAGKGAPASEAGKQTQERKRGDAASRLDEILADLKAAGFTPAELKTFRREAKQQEQQPAAAPPAKAGAPEQTAKPAGEPKAPEKPKLETFQGTYEEYQAALDKYHEDMTEFKIQQALGNDRQQRAHEAAQREIETKLAEAKKRYGDEAQPTIVNAANLLHNDEQVPPVIKAMLNDSAAPVDLLYVLGSKPEELAEFIALAKSNPGQAIRRLAVVENLVIEELAKGGKSADAGEGTPGRDPDGKFTPAKKTTTAPPPSKEAGGRSGAPADPVESAAGAGDFRAFREAANRRDLAHRRGQ